MGKATGFIEFARALPVLRAPQTRLGDWQEFHEHFSGDELRQQGARCMDCGVPFCQAGLNLNGAAAGCPLNNLIPEWNDLVYRGDWRTALDALHETNNFPEFTGRVCPAPCEGSCVLGINAEPVSIKSIECAIVDHGFEQGWIVPEAPRVRTGNSVAVVGSGPAGLACAAQLNKFGHTVTVFERDDRIGGLLMYGIPNMKLEKWRVERRVELLKAEGISFWTNVEVGKNYPTDRLMAEFDAVVLCAGSTRPRDLNVPNRQLSGIHFAMDFLRSNTRSYLNSEHRDGDFIDARGKDVVVIGGGDTGTDCVGTALRQGCRSLVQFEILPQSPNVRAASNPWPQWPRIHRVDYGQEEAQQIHGEDPRTYSIRTTDFADDGNGHVGGVRTVRIENHPGTGITDVPATEQLWPAQLVLLAMGFVGPEQGLVSELGVSLNGRGSVAVNDAKQTNVPKVFAAGDVERGQSLVVWAIADGRRAAASVDRHLQAMADAELDDLSEQTPQLTTA
jgi:glutamate synthase (NADPH/NADH) small chain